MLRIIKQLGKPKAPRAIAKSDQRFQTISCPFCAHGESVIFTSHDLTENRHQIDITQTPQCDTCHRRFAIRARTLIVGVPMEEHLRHGFETDPRAPSIEAR